MQLRNYKPIGLSYVKFTYQKIPNTVLSSMLKKKIPKTVKKVFPPFRLLGRCPSQFGGSSGAGFLGS